MTRRMADSIVPADLPDGFDLYGGYDDGLYDNVAAIKTRFPGKTVIAFTVFAQDNYGDCLDIENGNALVEQAPAWTGRRRASGHTGPLNYCAWENFPALRAQYIIQKVAEPWYIVAGYPAPDGDAIPVVPGCTIAGHQWIDHGLWDESIVFDYLPGIDPDPTPPTIEENDTVSVIVIGGLTHVFGVIDNVAHHWWQVTAGPDFTWHHEMLPTT